MTLTDNDLMPLGKYKGEKMANVPNNYLRWAHEDWKRKAKNRDILDYIKDNLDSIYKTR